MQVTLSDTVVLGSYREIILDKATEIVSSFSEPASYHFTTSARFYVNDRYARDLLKSAGMTLEHAVYFILDLSASIIPSREKVYQFLRVCDDLGVDIKTVNLLSMPYCEVIFGINNGCIDMLVVEDLKPKLEIVCEEIKKRSDEAWRFRGCVGSDKPPERLKYFS